MKAAAPTPAPVVELLDYLDHQIAKHRDSYHRFVERSGAGAACAPDLRAMEAMRAKLIEAEVNRLTLDTFELSGVVPSATRRTLEAHITESLLKGTYRG